MICTVSFRNDVGLESVIIDALPKKASLQLLAKDKLSVPKETVLSVLSMYAEPTCVFPSNVFKATLNVNPVPLPLPSETGIETVLDVDEEASFDEIVEYSPKFVP